MSETTPNPPTDPRDGFTPGPWRAEFNTYRENGSLTITDSYIHSPEGARMFLDCDPEQASRIVDGMNERNALLADNERLTQRVAKLEAALAGFRQFGGQVAAHAEQLRQQGEAIAFMQRIASEDARIVSTRDLLGEQIIEAQRTGEMFVDANGYGYVLLPWSLRSTRDSVPGASP